MCTAAQKNQSHPFQKSYNKYDTLAAALVKPFFSRQNRAPAPEFPLCSEEQGRKKEAVMLQNWAKPKKKKPHRKRQTLEETHLLLLLHIGSNELTGRRVALKTLQMQ